VTYPPPLPAPKQSPPQALTSPQYGEWARSQRLQGTVYGSGRPGQPGTDPGAPAREAPGQYLPGQRGAGDPASSLELHRGGSGPLPLDSSGSLTGHILAQGRSDASEPQPRGPRAVVIVLVSIAVLAVAAALGAVLVLSGTI
jgi:hypothetical protein